MLLVVVTVIPLVCIATLTAAASSKRPSSCPAPTGAGDTTELEVDVVVVPDPFWSTETIPATAKPTTSTTRKEIAALFLGRPGWRNDMRHGLAMARSADPMSYASAVGYVYNPGIPFGVLRPDDRALREIEDALQIAERSGDDLALTNVRITLGLVLVHRHTAAERDRGQQLLAEGSEVFVRPGHNVGELPIVNVYLASERARRGDRDDAIPLMRAAVDHLFREGQLLGWGIPVTGVLVETLLDRGTDADVAEAQAAIARFAAAPADDGLVIRDIWLLRLRVLLARARGDEAAYRDDRDRYRDMARTLGFEGHIAWAEAMT